MPVHDGRAHHYHIAAYRGRRDEAVAFWIGRPHHALGQVDAASTTKRRIGLAGAGIETVKGVGGGAKEYSRSLSIAPVGHAPAAPWIGPL